MHYKAELDFLRKVFERMRIRSYVIGPHDILDESLDLGLRKFLGHEKEYIKSLREAADNISENTVYKMTDAYHCKYIFFVLPETERGLSVLIGPYLSAEMDKESIMETAERFNIPASRYRQLEKYYAHIPVVADDSTMLVMISTLAERIWGYGNAYHIVDLNQELSAPSSFVTQNAGNADILMQMKIMESRYAYENELMDTVSKGLVHRAELLISRPSQNIFEQRVADPLRNMKNYCIICNTLMRKAAEKGGVHPMHLDSLSSNYAKKIELIAGPDAGQKLILEMVHQYCRLVRRHNIKDYSPPVQKTITYIKAELAGDLSLEHLARINNVSPSYLSNLFHKETGKTITGYINENRMENGARLLKTTKLQIQTIAEYCGVSDAGYFTKLFKKHYSLSPKDYREQIGIIE